VSLPSHSLWNAALRARQLRGVETKIRAGLLDHLRVQRLAGTIERQFRLSTFAMHRYHHGAITSLVFVMVELTSSDIYASVNLGHLAKLTLSNHQGGARCAAIWIDVRNVLLGSLLSWH
jgi:hypothetical protein